MRDLREYRAPVSEEEFAEFETDVLAGFVLARASAGLVDSTICNDTSHLELVRDWFGRLLWEMEPADADVYFGKVLRDAKPSTRTGRAGALAVFFQFLELRHKAELHNLTGRVVECPPNGLTGPLGNGAGDGAGAAMPRPPSGRNAANGAQRVPPGPAFRFNGVVTEGRPRPGARSTRLRHKAAGRTRRAQAPAPLGTRQPVKDSRASRHGRTASGRPQASPSASHTATAFEQSWWMRLERTVSLLATAATLSLAAFTWVSLQQVDNEQAINREGQITDRYNAAVENLGNQAQEVRLGGIYALQRIMQDSRRDYPTVIDVLSAYVRTHAVQPPKNGPGPRRPAQDVEAALGVFCNRDPGWGSDRLVIDLAGTYLRGAVLRGTNLTHADLTGADLSSADLGQTSGPALTRVGDPDHVRATVLSGATLHRANLDNANMQAARLNDADLRHASLRHARLGSASLPQATLDHADLSGADLSGADLSNAHLTQADLGRAFLTEAKLTGAFLEGTDLSGANLRGTDLDKAQLTGANLRGADLRDIHPVPENRTRITVQTLLQARLDHTTKLPARLAQDPRVQRALEKGGRI
ncbi:pentapeptide repeat-containing protein [Streptomyces chrestomyceticus]|uniref:pentapeptide repeat-containing protein n=1 Tax=Streptomyces chrestomyceticus TaxID=68185 RepID=UPI003687072F